MTTMTPLRRPKPAKAARSRQGCENRRSRPSCLQASHRPGLRGPAAMAMPARARRGRRPPGRRGARRGRRHLERLRLVHRHAPRPVLQPVGSADFHRHLHLEFSALVKIRIEKDGTISDVSLAQSSGNDVMDKSVMEAARKVTQVDPLPQGLGDGPPTRSKSSSNSASNPNDPFPPHPHPRLRYRKPRRHPRRLEPRSPRRGYAHHYHQQERYDRHCRAADLRPGWPPIARTLQSDLAASGYFTISTPGNAWLIAGGSSSGSDLEGKVSDHSGRAAVAGTYSGTRGPEPTPSPMTSSRRSQAIAASRAPASLSAPPAPAARKSISRTCDGSRSSNSPMTIPSP